MPPPKLYVLRHAHATAMSAAGVLSDEERPLSPQGRKDAEHLAQLILQRACTPQIILTSPLKRARQTSQIIAERLKPKDGVQLFEPLSNRIPGSELFEQLRNPFTRHSEILVVGHQPQLGEMVYFATGREQNFHPCTCIALELGSGASKASLLWIQDPSEKT